MRGTCQANHARGLTHRLIHIPRFHAPALFAANVLSDQIGWKHLDFQHDSSAKRRQFN